MKQLNTACNAILTSAKQMQSNHVEPSSSSTNNDGLTIGQPPQWAEQAPEDNTRTLIVKCNQFLKSSITIARETVYHAEYGPTFQDSYTIPPMTLREKALILQVWESYQTPMPKDKITELIGKWMVVCVGKKNDDKTTAQMNLCYIVEELYKYPADVVYDVLANRMYKFFPDYYDLIRDCTEVNNIRQNLYQQIKNAPVLEDVSDETADR